METTTQTQQTQMTDSPAPSEVFGGGQQTTQTPDTGVQQQQPTQTQQPTQSAPAAPAITAEMIAEAVKTGVAAVQPKPAPAAPTPEEIAQFDRQFNVIRVTPDMYKAILGVAPQSQEQLKALEQALHGSAKQAIAMSQYLANQEIEKRLQAFQQQMSPVQNFVQQQQHQALETEFYSRHADLKDHGALCKELALAAQAQRIPFKSPQEAMDFVANKARSLLGKAAPTGQPVSTRTTQRHSMTPTSLGGNPGSGRSPQPGNSATVSPKDVFGGTAE